VASYPNNLQLIYEHVAQLLAAVESQFQAIKEFIENDVPCSDSFMREIALEQGLPSPVPYGSSTSTPSAVDFLSPPNTNKPLEEDTNQVLGPFPTPSLPVGEKNLGGCQVPGEEYGNSSQQSRVPREPHRSSQSPNIRRRPLSQASDAYRESIDDHGVSSNPNKPDIPAAKQACTGATQKPTRPTRQPVKRSAQLGKETMRKKKVTTFRQRPTVINCKFSTATIYEPLQNHCRNPDISGLLTCLFFAVASPEAFVQAKDAYRHLQSGNIQIHLSRTNTVSDHMRCLDQLTSSSIACRIIERSLLVQLVNRRDELVRKFKAQQGRRLRMRTEAKNQLRLQRVDGLALSTMMEEAFPMLKDDTDAYKQRQTTLRNRLSKGRNWHNFAARFGNGVLALVPIDGEFQIHDRA